MAITEKQIREAAESGRNFHINQPSETHLCFLETLGYTITAEENVGLGIMEPCEPGLYSDPEVVFIDQQNKEATINYL